MRGNWRASRPGDGTSAESRPPRASVIVINWNGRRWLDACLEAVLAQELEGGHEVLLTDNGSTDGSVAHVRERWPAVRIVETGGNLGFAGGNNAGMRVARGTHIVLLNNDTRVRPGWLRALVGAIESDDRTGAVTSKLVFMDRPDVIQNAGSLLLTDGSGADRGSGEPDDGRFSAREQVFAACGAAVLFRRAMLDDVGLLDETFFNYYEDTDLSWRMRLRGWHVLYEPAAVVEHAHAATGIEWSPFFIFHVDRNRLFMILKNAPATFVVRAFTGFAYRSARMLARVLLRRGRTSGTTPGRGAPAASRARIHARVVGSLLWHLPQMLGQRWRIRRRRTVTDAAVLRWMYPREAWDRKLAGS